MPIALESGNRSVGEPNQPRQVTLAERTPFPDSPEPLPDGVQFTTSQ